PAEDVEEHEGHVVRGGDHRGVPGGDGVEPADAARPAGDGAVLAADPADALADAVGAVGQFGRERAAADAGRIRLEHADDAGQVAGGEAGPAPDAGRGAVRAGDERVTAVVHVEQAALGGLKDDPLAGFAGAV